MCSIRKSPRSPGAVCFHRPTSIPPRCVLRKTYFAVAHSLFVYGRQNYYELTTEAINVLAISPTRLTHAASAADDGYGRELETKVGITQMYRFDPPRSVDVIQRLCGAT